MKNLFFIYIFIAVVSLSCKKEDIASASTTPSTNCRIQEQYGEKYVYNADGFITKRTGTYLDANNKTVTYEVEHIYTDGLLTSVKEDGIATEAYSYTNGVLSQIKLLVNNDPDYKDYKINIETDVNKRIIKMTDTNGLQSDLKRDEKGNLIEVITINVNTKKVISRYVRSNFDGKKTHHELLKGWQFDVRKYYGDYMDQPNFIIGGSGNALNIKIYGENNLLTFDADYLYTYTFEGYWKTQDFTNKINGVKSSSSLLFDGCK